MSEEEFRTILAIAGITMTALHVIVTVQVIIFGYGLDKVVAYLKSEERRKALSGM